MAKPLVIDAFRIDIGNTINPTVVLPSDVPAGANAVAVFFGGTDDSSLNVVAASSDFTGAMSLQQVPADYAGYGLCAALGAITATGPGRTFTPQWNIAPPFGPECVAAFLKVDDPADFAASGAFSRASGSASAVATPSSANDLMLVAQIVYGDTAPAVPTGGTNVWVSPSAIRDSLIRVSTVPTVTPTTTVNRPAGDYSAMIVLPIKDKGGASDTTPPTLSSPTGTKTGSTTATGTVSTNEANGTAYAVVTTSATKPTETQVRAGQNHTGASAPWAGNQGVASTGVKTFNATGLAASTTYYYHFTQRDAANNDAAVVSSAAFTTDPPADTTPPTLTSPTGAATGSTTASGSVSTNEANGTLYRVTTVNATESAATVKGGASQSVTATGVQNMGATGLSPGTTYRHHYLHRDAAGNDSAVVSSAPFTTTASDTTPPTLSAASAAATSHNTATGGVSTTEAGPAWAVITTSATTPSAAQIKAGQSHTGAAAVAAATATLAPGANAAAFGFSGLSGSTAYRMHVVQDDGAGNTATPITSAQFTTSAPPDTTAPTLSSGNRVAKSNALVVLGASTNEANGSMYAVLTTSATPPSAEQVMAGQNHAGAAAVWSGNQAIASTGAKSFNATGLVQLTTYYPYVMHRDAAGNNSAVLSLGAVTTFRDGATGQYIWDNTAAGVDHAEGFLRNDVQLPGDADKWFSWRYGTPPSNPADWVINADGSFVYSGTVDASFTYQLEVDGVDVGGPTTVLVQAAERAATPANSRSPSTSSASNAIQTNQATAANSRSPSTSGASLVTQTHTATPANSNSPSRSTSAVAGQDNAATPANSVSPSTSTASSATQNSIATPANSNSPSTSSSASAYTPGLATPADSVSGSTSSSSTVSQDRYANPVDSVSGSTSEASTVTQTHVVVPADSAGPSTSRSSRAFNFNLTLDPDFAEYAFDDDEAAYYGE